MTLRDLMAQHAREVTRLDHLGEPVTIHPVSGDPDRIVNAVVNRQVLEPYGDDPRDTATIQAATVFVSFQDLPFVDDGDEITMPIRLGAAPVRCRIAEVVDSDELGWTLRVVA